MSVNMSASAQTLSGGKQEEKHMLGGYKLNVSSDFLVW